MVVQFQASAAPAVQAQHTARHKIIAFGADAIVHDAGEGGKATILGGDPHPHDIALHPSVGERCWPVEIQALTRMLLAFTGEKPRTSVPLYRPTRSLPMLVPKASSAEAAALLVTRWAYAGQARARPHVAISHRFARQSKIVRLSLLVGVDRLCHSARGI
jgi:hypothetical protein